MSLLQYGGPSQQKGGKPSPGTPKDKRLKENKPPYQKPVKK